MYKVFINDSPIILTSEKNFSTNLKKVSFNKNEVLQYVEKIYKDNLKGICLVCSDLKTNWKEFKTIFKLQKAAGGKVVNENNEVLFIYRFNKWDLPKGKIEKNESKKNAAIREVEEECGVKKLEIHKKLETTYHLFMDKGQFILKITHWYLMSCSYYGKLKPQREEGIEKVKFMNEAEVEDALKLTYENIKLLF